ncbi:MAG: SUMF1/EgtB/PvdO family nonheme iron enzyme [Planctomycetes bacterium]|nr:SUMF1/EgtB/PvdO family nonheme iron enzyme [Planctomycetota bacterium]
MTNPVLALLQKYALPVAQAIARRLPGVDLMLDLQEAFTDQVQEERIETLEGDVALFAAQVDHMESFRELVLGEMAALRDVVRTALERDSSQDAAPVTDELVEERTTTLQDTLLDLPRNATFARNAVESVARSFSDQETLRVVRPDVRRTIARTLFPNAEQTTGLKAGHAVPEWPRWGLVKPLGLGGFGEVWLARNEDIWREVAVKFCIDESKAQQLEREIQAVRRLSHRHIVPLVDAALKTAFPAWIAFEYVPGGTLTEWIRAEPRTQEQIVARLDEVLQALEHAHEMHVWHRDVKPDNVLIDASGRALLTDFGIGKVIAEERQQLVSQSLGLSMTISGTTMYMPPEVLNAQKPADARADVYAFGTLAWQLLVGDPTLARPDDWMEDLREAGGERFEAFLVKCFARYERRFAHAGEVRVAFESMCSASSPAAPASRVTPAPSSPPPVATVPAEPQPTPRVVEPSAGDERAFEIPGAKIAIPMIWCPPGTFLMGSPDSDSEAFRDEKPQHEVTLTRGFWIGKTPVTQAQYEAVIGKNPSHFKGSDRPVEKVSHEDAVAFAKKLAEKEGGGWPLPTEAEWEYACRAGNEAPRYGELDQIAWYDKNSGGETHPVGRKAPNAWGLHDTLGNVWEWVQDWGPDSYTKGSATTPTGPSSGVDRVIRGGGWNFSSLFCRAPIRIGIPPGARDGNLGFRLARSSR